MLPTGAVSRALASGAVAGVAGVAASAPSSSTLGSRVTRGDAGRPAFSSLAPPEVEELTIFPGGSGSDKCTGENSPQVRATLDSWVEISEDDVREAIGPIVSFPSSVGAPASPPSDSESDGTEANNIIMQTDAIIRNIQTMANDTSIREAVYNHPAMQEMLSLMSKGQPLLMPAAAAVLASSEPRDGHQVIIQDVTNWNLIDIIAERLDKIGSHLSKVCSKIGSFFQGVAAKVTNRNDQLSSTSAKPGSTNGRKSGKDANNIITIMFALVCIVLLSFATKRIVTTGR